MAILQMIDATLLVYGFPFVLLVVGYAARKHRHEKQSHTTRSEHRAAGLTEPPSLHPSIDPLLCIGCGSCVTACPEKNVLGLIDKKAQLVAPTECIGHGACKVACPEGAIELVFGTERRGVDIPNVAENYETNVPGIFVAGELGGMGLIRNAVRQGAEAITSISEYCKGLERDQDTFDVVIVGAGPAGLASGLAAIEKGLSYVILEQESLGGTVAHYPRGKIVMTAPMRMPLIGQVKITETTKEALLEFWHDAISRTGLGVSTNERVEEIQQQGSGFEIKTHKGTYKARSVLLAIGRRGSPRRLGVSGEDQDKVVYRLMDPEQYRGQNILVVGGGDSALEAATVLSDEPGTRVTLSYRSDSFSRARPKNRKRVDDYVAAGKLDLFLASTVTGIEETRVLLDTANGPQTLKNDSVIICAGGILPTGFLKDAGVEVETKFGTA